MNKHLLTLAGLLSLLTVNQAFSWELKIKNETALNLFYRVGVGIVFISDYSIDSFTNYTIMAGETAVHDIANLGSGSVQIYPYDKRDEMLASFSPRKDRSGKTINPLKGLTIKTVNGKTVIVENP